MLRLRLYAPLFLPTLHLDVPIYILCPGISGSERVCFALIALHLFFDLNLSSMHCNRWFLDGNTNPLCQRGHFPPCTKLISIPHHPITPPHLIETAYIFQRQPHFFCTLYMYDKTKAYACVREMCSNRGHKVVVAKYNTTDCCPSIVRTLFYSLIVISWKLPHDALLMSYIY